MLFGDSSLPEVKIGGDLGRIGEAAKDLRIGGEVGKLANVQAPSTSQKTTSSDNIALLALEAAAGESLGSEVEVWSTEPIPFLASLTFSLSLSLSH